MRGRAAWTGTSATTKPFLVEIVTSVVMIEPRRGSGTGAGGDRMAS